MRLTICEDSVLLREGLIRLLTEVGHEVVAALSDAVGLMDSLACDPPDFCILDVRLPPTFTDEGVRAALQVRERYPELPVLVLSQYVEERYAGELIASSTRALGYLLKDRVAHVQELTQALQTVACGGVVVDRKVITALMRRREDRLERLTPREREVLQHVSAGETNHGIAEALHLSDGAVVKHIGAIFDKLGLSRREGNRRVLAVLAFLDHP